MDLTQHVASGDPKASIRQEVLLINFSSTVKYDPLVLLGKGYLPVMLFLIDDVLLHYRYLLLRVGECRIALTPSRKKRK